MGDFDDWIGLGVEVLGCEVSVIGARCDALPALDGLAGVVITGSHAMVSEREPWSEGAAAWLRAAVQAGVPVLGICYGHRLPAHCLGGEVSYHPGGIEIGSVDMQLRPEATVAPRVRVHVHRVNADLELHVPTCTGVERGHFGMGPTAVGRQDSIRTQQVAVL